ncbi:zinc finger, CCHC-type containing protein [Tanacetum coccineum]|uniref:Zinc finger, CCHC-type containing protein n=1 Tax=Tanacetum coccineum TaxID=301880 RepID=A0ABQ5C8N2_9ASTR
MEWYRNLRIVLSVEDKLPFLEQPIPAMPVLPAGQVLPPDVLNTHTAWVKASKEIAGLMLMTMDPDIQKNLEHLGAYDMLKELKMLYAQQADQELLQTVRESHACKQEEGQFVSSYVLKMKSYIDNLERLGRIQKNQKKKSHKAAKGNQGKGKAKMGYAFMPAPPFAPKPKNPPTPKKDNPAKDAICHQCGEVGHWRRNCPIYLAELMKKKKLSQGASTSGIFTIELYSFPSTSWVYDTGCGTHICITTQGLKGKRKLKPGALSLYVGDGHRATVEVIGEFHLCLPSGLVLVLHNCHYLLLQEASFQFYDDIFEIDLSSSYTNDSSMYAISNKGAKLNLDYTLLWHCRLGHINKKRMEKLQHDGLLNSTDITSLEKCVSCMSGKMARKPYSHQVKRAKDLLGLIHTDDHEIIAHRTPPYTPQMNGVSERRNQTLLDMVRFMTSQTTLPKSFWDYALESDARILNMVQKVDKTPYEVWHGQAPKLSYLKVWGCEAFVKHDTLTKPDKLEPRAFKCIFVGYPKETIGYFFYYPPENKLFVAWNAEFFENDIIDQEASGSLEDLEIIQEEDTHPSIDTSLRHE